jgi:hypothetical protein
MAKRRMRLKDIYKKRKNPQANFSFRCVCGEGFQQNDGLRSHKRICTAKDIEFEESKEIDAQESKEIESDLVLFDTNESNEDNIQYNEGVLFQSETTPYESNKYMLFQQTTIQSMKEKKKDHIGICQLT